MHRVRFQWGYRIFYAPYPWQHKEYRWDGAASVHGGKILRSWYIAFKGSYGDNREELWPLAEPRWYWQHDTAQFRQGGVVLEIEGDSDCEVELFTTTATMRFPLHRLQKERLIKIHVGPRYSNVDVLAYFDGDDPNLDGPQDLRELTAVDGMARNLVDAKEFRGPVHRCWRIFWAWALPGQRVEVDIPRSLRKKILSRGRGSTYDGDSAYDGSSTRDGDSTFDGSSTITAIIRWSATAVTPGETPEEIDLRSGWNPGAAEYIDDLPYLIELNGAEVARGTQTFQQIWVPQIEELEVELPASLLSEAVDTLRITNQDSKCFLMIARVLFEERVLCDLEMAACPSWVVRGQEFEIELFCRKELRDVKAHVPSGITLLDVIPEPMTAGPHRLRMKADEPLADATVIFASATARCEGRIELVVASRTEPHTMLVGLEDGLLPKEIRGYHEDVLKHFSDNQLGNILVFRGCNSHERSLEIAECCRRLGLYFQVASSFNPRWAKEQADILGPLFKGYYWSEFDGFLFGYHVLPQHLPPNVGEEQRTMRTAYEGYIAYMKNLIAWVGEADPDMPNLALISASGISGYACEAGMSSTLCQLNKSHNTLLVADARGAARAYRRPFWGTYQAEGGHVVPEGRHHMRMWRMALQLAYVGGASQVNDEENLYRTQHCRVYSRGDKIPRTRQQILKQFFRYASSHPRPGTLKVRQACLLGRYACDVVDGLSRSDPFGQQNAPAVVWRTFGAWGPEWRPMTPEYGLRYLDVFLPGVWLTNLEQTPDIVRRWYSGSPLGEIELAPVDAPADILAQYKLLFLLGWNTMDEAQYGNLRAYVEQGGRLFMSVAHATRNESRKFLIENLEPLNLLRDGDFRDLFGVVVKGRGPRLNRIKGEPSVAGNPVGDFFQVPTPASPPPVSPQHSVVDLAEIELMGAEVLATDAESGAPVLVRYRVGKGEAYLLCTHEYPGNSRLVPFMKPLLRTLARTIPWPVELDDLSGDVYYTVREDDVSGMQTIHLLNTDWTEEGNEKPCRLRLDETWIDLTAKEGTISFVTKLGRLAVLIENDNVHVEAIRRQDKIFGVELHGRGSAEIKLRALEDRIVSARFGDSEVPLRSRGGWKIAAIAFGDRSLGELTIQVDDR